MVFDKRAKKPLYTMAELPLATIERIMKKAGAGRVSEDAKRKMREVLEEYIIKVTAMAKPFAKHAKRKTLKAKDIELALKTSK